MARGLAAPGPLIAAASIAAGIVVFAYGTDLIGAGAAMGALVVLALVVLIQLARTIDPAWLLSAGILSSMFAGRWGELGLGGPIGPHRVLLATGILAVLLRAPPVRDRPRLRLGPVHLAMAAAIAYAVISAIAAGTLGRSNSHFTLIDEFGALPFLMFAVAPVAFATQRQRMILLGSLVAAGAYLSVTALLEQLELYDLVVPSYITDPAVGTHFGRARGPFVEAAADGLALYACAVAAAIAFAVWRSPRPRWFAAAVLVLAPVGLLLTVTRSVWLAAVVGTVVAIGTTAGLRRFLVPVAVAGTLTVLATFALVPGLAQQARERQDDKAPIHERQNTTAAGLRMIGDRPLLGFGWDRANDHLEDYFRLDPDIPLTGGRAGFHNLFLNNAVNLGVVGFALWLLAGALAFGSAFTRTAEGDLRLWQVGLKAVLVTWIIVGLSTPASYIFSTMLLWTWAGVAAGLPDALPAARRRPARAPRPAPVPAT